ncbi:MAG: CoA-transferase, partial [bacterium]
MKSKEIAMDEALCHIKDGMTLMIGGFIGNNEPIAAIDRLVELGVKDLTLIAVVNAYPGGGFGLGKLIENHQ